MFVFEGAASGALALLDVATKLQVPVDEYVVVAGRVPSGRQLTCLGGRAKRDGKRRLLVVPLAHAREAEAARNARVQVLDVGGAAVQLLHGVRACFPTLVRKDLMADVDSDSDEEEDAARTNKHEDGAKTAGSGAATDPPSTADALAYLDDLNVQTFATLDELLRAYGIADAVDVHAALQSDPSVSEHDQLLCIECPPVSAAAAADAAQVGPLRSSSAGRSPGPVDFGVLFLSDLAPRECAKQFLHIPVPRSLRRPASAAAARALDSFQDATVLTFGTKREETVHGGGKTCDEMVTNIRLRHASGTFCTLVDPTTTWAQVAQALQSVLPQVRELDGELRLRRLVGPTPCGVAVKVRLES
ncbi:unnamed protein product [Hyaloperonospora brassicae]|uniref:Lon N-terminal domain-containing protein n=1 Tax=Hyaloperonospora brassicae TaxID=162125 RepID=A0AAV0TUQ4_HYABA|nr:unnamed protein product [Hyaloperonospora brassicae]